VTLALFINVLIIIIIIIIIIEAYNQRRRCCFSKGDGDVAQSFNCIPAFVDMRLVLMISQKLYKIYLLYVLIYQIAWLSAI